MKFPVYLFAVLGFVCSAFLVWLLAFGSAMPLFREQGAQLMAMVWGQISLADLYAGFFLACALVWILEPKLWAKVLVVCTLPFLGNPVLAIWLGFRLRYLLQLKGASAVPDRQ